MMELINKIFNNLWPELLIFIVAVCLIRFFYLQNHRERFSFHKEFWYLISIIYFILLYDSIKMLDINVVTGLNLVPFSEIIECKLNTHLFNSNIIGNILIFIPFGYIIGEYVNPKKIWPVLFTSVITSCVVEFVQYRINGTFCIDDILLNLMGSICGYLLYIGFNAIYKRLPDILKSDLIKNIFCLILIFLFGIYVFGYWGVIF